MKIYFAFMLLLLQTIALAKPVLHCLAEEESRYHKSGYKYAATYKLNKTLMSKLLNLGNVKFQKTTQNAVCSRNTIYPSIVLLEHIINYQEKAFIIPESEDPRVVYTQKGLVNEFMKQIPNLLHDFISHVQESCPTVDCLEKRVVGLTKYYEQLKYLQMDIPPKQILTQDNMAVKIMGAIKDIDRLVSDCTQEMINQKKKDKKENLKKEKSSNS